MLSAASVQLRCATKVATNKKTPLKFTKRNFVPIASLTVKDETSGTEFNLAQKFWVSPNAFRCMGAGTRSKKIVFVNVQVYSGALYVEAQKAATELGIRDRGGFFETDDDFCTAVVDGAFHKVIMLHMLRNIEGQQLSEALDKSMVPRMQLTGEMALLDQFRAFFSDKSLLKDTRVVLLWKVSAQDELSGLDVLLLAPGEANTADLETKQPQMTIKSASFSRAMFETFLGSNTAVPDVRSSWVGGIKKLLESERVARATGKGGSG